jgi:hypothetical protein
MWRRIPTPNSNRQRKQKPQKGILLQTIGHQSGEPVTGFSMHG